MKRISSRHRNYRQIGKASAMILFLTVVDKVLALAKEIMVANRFGISPELDAFNIAYALPGIIGLLFSGALISSLVPLYIEWSNGDGTLDADSYVQGILVVCTAFFGFIAILIFFLSPVIIPLLGYGFADEQKAACIAMERFLSFLIIIEGINVILSGLLQAKKKFFSLQSAPLFINITSIILLLFYVNRLGIYALVWGFILGGVLKLVFMLWVLKKSGFNFLLPSRASFSRVRFFLYLALPLLGSELIANVNLLIDQVMATSLSPGSVSTLRYAFRINDMPIQIVIVAFTAALFPFISEKALDKDYTELRHYFVHGVVLMAFLTLPVICGIFLFSQDIVAVLFHHGAFDNRAVLLTSKTLLAYSLGLFFLAYSFLNGTFFSALKDTKPMLYMGFLSIGLNVGFNLFFMRFFGVTGIALSTTFTLGIIALVFMGLLNRRIGIDFARLRINLTRILAAVVFMYFAGVFAKALLVGAGVGQYVYFPVAASLAGLCYLGGCWILKTDEMRFFLALLRKGT